MNYNGDISTNELEEIDQYLNGELSPAALEDFERRLAEDALLADKVADLRLLTTGIHEANLQKKLEEFHQNISSDNAAESTGGAKVINFENARRPAPLLRKLAVAAAILILLATPFYYFANRKSPSETLYAAFFKPDPGLVTAMGTTANYTFEKAMVAYKEKQYAVALEAWTVLANQQPSNDTLQYFIGAAAQAEGNSKLAREQLEKVAQQKQSAFYKDACWYLGLALLEDGEKDKAIEFIKLSGHPQSAELLQALNSK